MAFKGVLSGALGYKIGELLLLCMKVRRLDWAHVSAVHLAAMDVQVSAIEQTLMSIREYVEGRAIRRRRPLALVKEAYGDMVCLFYLWQTGRSLNRILDSGFAIGN